MKRALLVGASGLVGGHCKRLLLELPEWEEVISLVRTPSPIRHPRLREIVIDFAHPVLPPIEGLEAAFCCLGTTRKKAGSLEAQRLVDVVYVAAFARLAQVHAVPHFLVVSSLGADRNSSSPYLRMKGEMESEIRRLNFPATDVLQPSLLLGERAEPRGAESLAQNLFLLVDPLLNWLLPKYRAIAAEKVARAMVALAENPQEGFHLHASDTIPKLGGP